MGTRGIGGSNVYLQFVFEQKIKSKKELKISLLSKTVIFAAVKKSTIIAMY